ncbi:aminotransferase class I/II-fold pyridoxal phosphate-dependent enzyme [Shewanella sp. VB17]|uniref:aminotransferase class I/II-fold pyridoxal phosphate-dependent enzyme n=1 Tax=Shewanella sp. VB17 TaxID=2739432 RepID=UPI0035C8B95B
MSMSLSEKMHMKQTQLKQAGLLRVRQKIDPASVNQIYPSMVLSVDGVEHINFSSNDYLGLSQAPEMLDALCLSAKQYGVGSGSSPLVTGYGHAHQLLEEQLCQVTGHEAGLLFCSGFSANTALMKTLFNTGDTVVADKRVHASIVDGLVDSKATLKRFLHNDLASAERLMSKYAPQALVTESIFSMDGDVAPLADLSRLCRENNTCFIVDDAHGFGIQPALPATMKPVNASIADIQVVTFGKALGCQGAAILGSQLLIDFLVSNAREYIYSTALSPINASLALTAVKLTQTSELRAVKLAENIAYFKQSCLSAKIWLSESMTPIQPLIIGDVDNTLAIAEKLKSLGVWVGAIRPPTVLKGSARLRITITALHTHGDIDTLVNSLTLALG